MVVNIAHYIEKLTKLIANHPPFANVPFILVRGRPTTPLESIAMLERGEAVSEIVAAMAAVGMIPIEQDWILVEDYYRRLLHLLGPHPKIYIIGQEMSLE